MKDVEEKDAFWIVWCPTGANPSYRHDDYESAVKEAERLARKDAGAEFYVMGAGTMRKVDSMIRIDFSQPMPF
jgi:hypothetical protein